MNICSWNTWKKRYNPRIFVSRDFQKWWAKQTIAPTLTVHGFLFVSQDADYGFENGTRQWAENEARHYLLNYKKKAEDCEFVYFCSRGSNGYMDYRAVYVRFLDAGMYDTCINCCQFSEPVYDNGIIIKGTCKKIGVIHPYNPCAEFNRSSGNSVENKNC